MKTLTVIRTPLEVALRVHEVKGNDFFGVSTGDLLGHLPYGSAKPYIQADMTEEKFNKIAAKAQTPGEVQAAAISYLDFAVGKAVDHRGLSAGRSIDHYRSWLWLLVPDAEFKVFEDTEYPQYGAPQLKVAARLLDAEAEWDRLALEHLELERMADGKPCEPNCPSGCDQ